MSNKNTDQHNPKDTAITGQDLIKLLLDPSATFPCGGQDPNFDWFDEPEKHINEGHFRLRDELSEIREWKKRALLRGFTKGTVWEEEDFWDGTFLGKFIHENSENNVHRGAAQIIAHAFQNGRVLDMSSISHRSRTAIERAKNEDDLISELVSPKVIVRHFRTLLHYIQHAYPLPQKKKTAVYYEGSDGLTGTREFLKRHHAQVQAIIQPVIDELVMFLPKQSLTWHDLEMEKYPMEREKDYTYWMWNIRFYTP